MIIAITGSRTGVNADVVQRGLLNLILQLSVDSATDERPTIAQLEFRCGDASGVDLYARDWLRRNGYVVDVYCASNSNIGRLSALNERWLTRARPDEQPRVFRRIVSCSDWATEGLSAGRVRNAAMLQQPAIADLVAKFHDGTSPGTRHCAGLALELEIEVVDGVALAAAKGTR